MAPIIGYSNTRVNPTYSAESKGEYGQWLYTSVSRPAKVTGNGNNQPIENRNRQASFATLLKQAEQDNFKKSDVQLRPANRQVTIDILA